MSKGIAVLILTSVFLLGVVVGLLGAHVVALHAPHHGHGSGSASGQVASPDHEEVFVQQLTSAVDLSPEQEREVRQIVQETHADALVLHEELSPRVLALLSQASERIEEVLEPEQVAPFRHFAHEHHRRARHLLLGPSAKGSLR